MATVAEALALAARYRDAGDHAYAGKVYACVLNADPDNAGAHEGLGVSLGCLGRLEESLAHFDEAIRLQPERPDFRARRALALLVNGDFARGWEDYEWRLCPQPSREPPPRFGRDGSPPHGRTILLLAEQGAGDTLQFARYASLLARQGIGSC